MGSPRLSGLSVHNRLKLGARRSLQGREMKVRSTAFTLAAVLAGISAAAAQNYPSRPVTMVVPFAAGGPGGTITRLVGGPLGKTPCPAGRGGNGAGRAGTPAGGRGA